MLMPKLSLVALLLWMACSPKKEALADHQFLNRTAGEANGRRTLQILPPPTSDLDAFTLRPVGIDTVHVRQSALNKESQHAAVELLVKGYLSDGCSELHEAKQIVIGDTVKVEILARRPNGMICTMAIRPFRFYMLLNDAFKVGTYQLVVNDQNQRFLIKG